MRVALSVALLRTCSPWHFVDATAPVDVVAATVTAIVADTLASAAARPASKLFVR